MTLKISVITPSLNRVDLIKIAIQSVLDQSYPEVEHIIVDAGSTDGTLELLKNYPNIRVVTGPDRGMYDALNKGVTLATGEIISFLNTDDLYGEKVFRPVAPLFDDHSVYAVAGRAIVFAEAPNGERKIVNQYSPLDTDLMECSTIGSNYFNAWFFRKSVFEKIGGFKPDYQIAGDREFMFRFAVSGLKYVTLDQLAYLYRVHSDSLTFAVDLRNRKRSADEHLEMTDRYLNDSTLSQHVKGLLRQKRTQVTLEMAIRYLKLRQFNKILPYVFAGIRYDLGWPFKFGKTILQKSPDKVNVA